MRHNYHTRALVLARTPLGESSLLLTLISPELGLLRARVQGVRKPSAKLAHALTTFAESDVVLVRGKEGWRITGATLGILWHRQLPHEARLRAGRIASLILRLAPHDAKDTAVFPIFSGLLTTLARPDAHYHDAAECLAALRLLSLFGLDAGEVPGTGPEAYDLALLEQVAKGRAPIIARINHGISASGL